MTPWQVEKDVRRLLLTMKSHCHLTKQTLSKVLDGETLCSASGVLVSNILKERQENIFQ